MVQLTTQLIELYSAVYYQALYVPADAVAELLAATTDRRVEVTINGNYTWQAALMPDGKGNYFINVSKEVRRAAHIEMGDSVSVGLRPDNSQYGVPLPEELKELWKMDSETERVFHLLTPGKQRALLYQIGKPKTSATRARKAVQIMEYLKTTGGQLDFKELNAYIKADNARW